MSIRGESERLEGWYVGSLVSCVWLALERLAAEKCVGKKNASEKDGLSQKLRMIVSQHGDSDSSNSKNHHVVCRMYGNREMVCSLPCDAFQRPLEGPVLGIGIGFALMATSIS